MALSRFIRDLRSSLDAIDILEMLRWTLGFVASAFWAEQIARRIRGEEAADNWRITYSTAFYLALRSFRSANEIREGVALRESVGELHGSVVEMRTLLREASAEAEARDKRAAEREDKLYRVNVQMARVAGLTLLAAIVTLVVTIIK